MQWQRVLILAPHTDDAELACGGSIARLSEEGVEVIVAAFSTAQDSLPAEAPAGLLRSEFLHAMQSLKVPETSVLVYDYPVRRFSYQRQEILEDLVQLRRRLTPDAVLLPTGSDIHQDHQVINAEGRRAFKTATVWGYELPWNHVSFTAQAFITLRPRHVEAKWTALQAYQSQVELKRPYFSREFVESLARVRGLQAAVEFAEAYEVIRILW